MTIASSAPTVQPPTGDDPAQQLELLRRVTLGEYDIYALLGTGGMAAVYLALDLALDRRVAIKVMAAGMLANPGLVERFRLEARTAAALSHPHIIPIYAVRATPEIHYFVMKYVEGSSLDAVLAANGPLSVELVRTVLCQSGGALAYAHRHGVVHRDVKPANIMLDHEGFAVVTDFGIARVRDVSGLTVTGTVIGTPHYMSPEQFSGEGVDGRADQYSLGILAFQLLTGRLPFAGSTIGEVIRGHLLEALPDLTTLRPDCPPALAACVRRMTAKIPEERYASLDDVVAELSRMLPNDDGAVRTQLSMLARTGEGSRPKLLVPDSPVPVARVATSTGPSGAGLPVAGSAPTARSLARTAGGAALLMVVAGMVGGAIVSRTRPGAEVSPEASGEASPAAGTERFAAPSPDAVSTDPVPRAAGPAGSEPDDEPAAQAKLPTSSPPGGLARPATGTTRQARPRAGAGAPTGSADADRTARTPPEADRPARPARTDSSRADSARAPAPPPSESTGMVVTPPPPQDARVRLATRQPGAFLYVDDGLVGPLAGWRELSLPPGRVRLTIRAEECLPWDTTLVVRAGDETVIGFRYPRCGS